MLFTPIYIAMTFIKTWRIRSFRSRLLQFLSGNTSVAFCKVPENAAETPTLSSKLCTNPKNAYLCDLLDYTNATRICSMKPNQCIELTDWVSCASGLPLGSGDASSESDLDIDLLLECEMEPHEGSSYQNIITLESMGLPVAWKAGSHLAIVLRSNIEHLSVAGFHFVGGEFIIDHKLPVVRIQTVQLSGEPNTATDPSMRSFRSEIQNGLRANPAEFQWPVLAALLRKLSKVVDIKTDKHSVEMNGNGCATNGLDTTNVTRKSITLADVSCNTTKSLEENKSPSKSPVNGDDVIVENVTVEIQHSITPKRSSLTLDLKRGTSQLSASLLNISSQIKSVTTHKRIVSSKKSQPQIEVVSSQEGTPKSAKSSRPLVNTKSPNVLIYSDSVTTRANLEASLRKVLDCDRYTVYSVTAEALEAGAWRGRASLVAVAGSVGCAAPLLLAHLLDGGRLLALCSDVLHTVLPYYKTAEVRENEVVQFSFDRWKSVKMKHHIFCYQASPAKKQFSTENDRQPSKYTGHPGHSLAIEVLASEETWRTPSLLQATDTTNQGVAIFSQIHLEADPADYLTDEAAKTNAARLEILHKIVGELLGLHVKDPHTEPAVQYTRGFFLGNHVDKLSLVQQWCGEAEGGRRVHSLGDMTLQYCMRGEVAQAQPSANFLPVYVHECPDDFSTVDYFDNLTSTHIGRLVIYSPMLHSTQALAEGGRLAHGAGVAARRQGGGRGRAGNSWISTDGQALITVQLWMKLAPSATLVQHAAALAAARAARAPPGCQDLDIRIKWPNDIYYGRIVKIGGNLTTANCYGDDIVINTGTGVNITNSVPTTCLNDIIAEHNRRRSTTIAPVSVESYMARYCSQLEIVLDLLEKDPEEFFEMYYRYWLHDDEEIRVLRPGAAAPIHGRITGLDAAGWLRVRADGEMFTVAPDGNTFDLMAGLIAPK